MKVRILTHYYPPEAGAPQMRLEALARGLAGEGHEVCVHTGYPNYPDGAIKPPFRNRPFSVDRDGEVRVVRSMVYPAPNRGFGRRIANHAAFAGSALATGALGGGADVVLVETPPLLLAAAAVPYARAKRARLVMNVADLWPDSAIEMGSLDSERAIAAARALERAAYRAADAIACPTEGMAEALEEVPEAAGKAVLMRPAVDLDRFDALSPRHPREGEAIRVLYAGTVGLAQGLGTLLEAFGLLDADVRAPAIELTIAGDGAAAAELRARLERHGPSGVRMIGSVAASEIPALYAESDIAVVALRDLPIFRGALPTKMLEAMAAARPVVLSARGEAAELISGEGAGVVVEPESPEAMARALADLAGDPARRAALGAGGRSAVEREFGRSAWIERWRELLAQTPR